MTSQPIPETTNDRAVEELERVAALYEQYLALSRVVNVSHLSPQFPEQAQPNLRSPLTLTLEDKH